MGDEPRKRAKTKGQSSSSEGEQQEGGSLSDWGFPPFVDDNKCTAKKEAASERAGSRENGYGGHRRKMSHGNRVG